MGEAVLSLHGVTKSFGAFRAVDDVSLDLRGGEIHALIGPNGAGKTTLISQIAGTLLPDTGRIMLGDLDMTGFPAARRARAGLGRTFQISSLAMPLSALANVRISAMCAKGPWGFLAPVARDRELKQVAEAALDRVGLAGRTDIPVAQLSHGERRQVELASAMALSPRLLLLDEPMAGLGAEGSARMTELLDGLRDTCPMLLIEHDMDAVFRLADRISVLVAGRVVASGLPADIRADPAVRAAYLGADDA